MIERGSGSDLFRRPKLEFVLVEALDVHLGLYGGVERIQRDLGRRLVDFPRSQHGCGGGGSLRWLLGGGADGDSGVLERLLFQRGPYLVPADQTTHRSDLLCETLR